ncbi:MAG TPA: hypothetical protein EYQ24_10500 [Bacteroidetes bacterium]|nr:hypothetical protein [Bacteroidota bacterium]
MPADRSTRDRERTKLLRFRDLERHVARGLDGELDCLIIEFHHDDELHVSVKAFDRPMKGGPARR